MLFVVDPRIAKKSPRYLHFKTVEMPLLSWNSQVRPESTAKQQAASVCQAVKQIE